MKSANNGSDILIEQQNGTLNVTAQADVRFFFEGTFTNEEAEITVGIFAISEATGAITVIGLDNSTPIKTANGADVIKGISQGTAFSSAIASAGLAASITALESSNVSFEATAQVFAEAIANITAVGIDNSKKVFTGRGDDLVVGEATTIAITEAITSTFTSLDTSVDETSQVRAFIEASASALSSVNATAIGLRGGEYYLEKGDDTIRASATGEGVNIGVQDILIDGGKGDDTFHLQSGTGTVIGGKGSDLLTLEGSIADYSFTALDLSLGINIQNSNNGTNLLVSEVEEFQFTGNSGIIYQYTDLSIG